jgi:hypothetical protein
MRGKSTTMHGEAYRQAVAAGRKITLHRPMDDGTITRLPD